MYNPLQVQHVSWVGNSSHYKKLKQKQNKQVHWHISQRWQSRQLNALHHDSIRFSRLDRGTVHFFAHTIGLHLQAHPWLTTSFLAGRFVGLRDSVFAGFFFVRFTRLPFHFLFEFLQFIGTLQNKTKNKKWMKKWCGIFNLIINFFHLNNLNIDKDYTVDLKTKVSFPFLFFYFKLVLLIADI